MEDKDIVVIDSSLPSKKEAKHPIAKKTKTPIYQVVYYGNKRYNLSPDEDAIEFVKKLKLQK